MNKPAFNPSEPFQAVKPAFDPSQPFEAPTSEPQSPPTLKTIAKASIGDFSDIPGVPDTLKTPGGRVKAALGVAEGIGENFNLLNVPHNLEVMGRAAFQESSDPNKGFFQNIAQRMGNAETKAIAPNADIPHLAAGIRTLAVLPFSNKSISEVYKDQFKEQKNYEDKFLPPGSKTTGEVIGGVVNLGLLAKDVAASIGFGAKAESLANAKAFDAFKGRGAYANQLINDGKAEEIGRQVLDDGIVTANASYKDILTRTQAKLSEYGEQVGWFSKAADKAMAQDSAIQPISIGDLSNKITKDVVTPLLSDPSTKSQGKLIANWIENLNETHPDGVLSFERAQELKTSLGKLAKFNRMGSNADHLNSGAYQDVYHIFNDVHDNGVTAALSKASQDGLLNPSLVDQFQSVKNSFSNLKNAELFIEKTVGSARTNRGLSLTDHIVGSTAAIAGGEDSNAIEKVGLGVTGAIANHLLRTKGNQAVASFFNSISKSMNASTGIMAPAVEGTGAINITKKALSQ